MTFWERDFWIYMMGVGLSFTFAVFRLRPKCNSERPEIFALKFTLYVLSSWIGIADAIIDSAIWYYKSKRKEIRDKKISEWLKK